MKTSQVKKSHRDILIEVFSDLREMFYWTEQDSIEFMTEWHNDGADYNAESFRDFEKDYKKKINDILAKIKLLDFVSGRIPTEAIFAVCLLRWWRTYLLENQQNMHASVTIALAEYRNFNHFVKIIESALESLKQEGGHYLC